MRRALGMLLLLAAGCSDSSGIALHYRLDGIDPAQVVRVETVVSVDPTDMRQFTAESPYRAVATGVGYEVRRLSGSMDRKMLITFDSTIGYHFAPRFDFTILPPPGEAAPKLLVVATAYGATTQDVIGVIAPIPTRFPGSVDIDLKDARCSGQSCSGSTQACCAGVCAETATDIANCGGCGQSCGAGGDSCSGQHCRCAGASGCQNGASCCTGLGCVDVMTDAFNCGACGHVCNPGEQCTGGACTCNGGAACAAPNTACCAGGCAVAGCACGATGDICAAPSTCCGGTSCVDLASDNTNCGACGRTCAMPLTCAAGECQCNGTVCAASDSCCPSGCRNTKNDPTNCGACGKACSAGEVCVDGQCQCGSTTCTADQACCNGQCTPTATDTQNCGSCGNACRPGEQCASGACFCTTLPSGGTLACVGNQTCCADGCFDLSSDPGHCGTCTNPCASGFACMMGTCVKTTCVPACDQKNQCVGTQCSCNGGAGCMAPSECCASGCADTSMSFGNCGVCGKSCNPGESCVGGNCLRPDGATCTASSQCVNGHCVDGYCCNSSCNNACKACNLSGHLGDCRDAPRDMIDPRGLCMMSDQTTCGLNGRCDGNGACEKWPSGTVCGAQTCDPTSNLFTPSPTCNGTGICKTNPAVSCSPYVCNSQAQQCFRSCTSAAQCVPSTCSTSDPSVVTSATCFTAGTGSGSCIAKATMCSPYLCNPGASTGGAACYAGACATLLTLCTVNNICAPGCSCQQATLCLDRQCGCP